MKRSFYRFPAIFAALCGIFLFSGRASAAVIDFEGLADFDAVTNQYAGQGVTFTGAVAAVAPPSGTLNEIDFPPVSGITVVTNDLFTSMLIEFGPYPFLGVSGWFTYGDYGLTGDPLTVSAFSPTDALNPILSLTLAENLGSPALLSFSGIGPIASLRASGGRDSYFTLDDLSVNDAVIPGRTVVPEPSAFALMVLGLAGVTLLRRLRF